VSLYWINDVPSGRLAIFARPRGGDWLGDDLQRLRSAGVEIVVSMLTRDETEELGLNREQEECGECGIEFLNFPIEDRGLPNDVVGFRKFADELSSRMKRGQSIAIHCRAGIGRSSMMACAVLLSLGVRCEDALRLVQAARGCTVPDTPEQRSFVEGFSRT